MRQPLPLDIPSAAKLRIKSVELVSSGRSEVSMHPGTHSQIIQGEAAAPFTRAHDYLVHEITLAASGYFKI